MAFFQSWCVGGDKQSAEKGGGSLFACFRLPPFFSELLRVEMTSSAFFKSLLRKRKATLVMHIIRVSQLGFFWGGVRGHVFYGRQTSIHLYRQRWPYTHTSILYRWLPYGVGGLIRFPVLAFFVDVVSQQGLLHELVSHSFLFFFFLVTSRFRSSWIRVLTVRGYVPKPTFQLTLYTPHK